MRKHAVLFVDDEINILKAVKRLLRNEPWEVQCASRPQEALELLHTQTVQVVVSDQRMPEMSGVDLLAAVRERHPDVVRMMLTGYTEMNVAVEAINHGEIYRLNKALERRELKARCARTSTIDLKGRSAPTRSTGAELQAPGHERNSRQGRDRTSSSPEARTSWHRYIQTIAHSRRRGREGRYNRGHRNAWGWTIEIDGRWGAREIIERDT